ncbi:hypothetical protein BH23VER1_BH23VER1_06370 [soil metagenome]
MKRQVTADQRSRAVCRPGFTLVEALITITIIGIMAAAVITAFANASQDSRRVIARQQQAVLQSAVNNWVSSQLRTSASSVYSVRAAYNDQESGKARLDNLIRPYLDESTWGHFNENTTNAGQLKTEALAMTGQYLSLPDWAAGSYPKVNLNAD